MKTTLATLISKITYMNVILTVIAVLLALQVAIQTGLLSTKEAHAVRTLPVHIESVSGNLPVSIKAPVTILGGFVCTANCK